MSSSPASSPGLLTRVGAGVTKFRNFVVNTLFVLLVVLILTSFAASFSSQQLEDGIAL